MRGAVLAAVRGLGLTISRKIICILGGCQLAFAGILSTELLSTEQVMLDGRRAAIRYQVEAAHSIVRSFAKQAEDGAISVEEAKRRAGDALRAIRFNGGDYVFVYSAAPGEIGRNLVHPDPKIEGTKSRDDEAMMKTFVGRMIEGAREGGGFTAYRWPRIGAAEPAPKIAYSLLFEPWRWTVNAALYVDDIEAASRSRLVSTLFWLVPLGLGIAAAGFLLVRSITAPLAAFTAALRRLAAGEIATAIPGVGRRDEIGQMAEAAGVFRDSMIQAQTLSEEQRAQHVQREERATRREELTRDFDASAGALLMEVDAAASGMQEACRTMTEIAAATARQTGSAAQSAHQASTNVQTVAAATEQLTASIAEIGSQVVKSAAIASQAATEAQRTDRQIQGLAATAERIGAVVRMISGIAEQTNLLALNATIEAARAGEAGRGFAVVAAEVKMLAGQTAKATDEIALQIGAIQSETNGAVEAVQSIAETVHAMNAIASAIAAAVEQQRCSTGDISRNIEQASQGTGTVSEAVASASTAAGDTRRFAEEVGAAAAGMSLRAEALRSEVVRFLGDMRAA